MNVYEEDSEIPGNSILENILLMSLQIEQMKLQCEDKKNNQCSTMDSRMLGQTIDQETIALVLEN